MKKIVWISPDCFVDVDLPVIPLLCKQYYIHWIIQFDSTGNRYKESDFEDVLKKTPNLTIEFLYFGINKRYRNPLNTFDHWRIKKIIDNQHPDLIYSNMSLWQPWQLPLVWALPYKKTIFTAHQGRIHAGMNKLWLNKLIRDATYRNFKYIHMFSKSQATYMRESYRKPKIFQATLPIKDFGVPTSTRPDCDVVRFTSFGRLVPVKRIDLLIDAACNIYERGYKNIKVVIKGDCSNWNHYLHLIRYPEIFETDIRMIDNCEIPNLFNKTHFFVQPYSAVSQSGPMKIGFRYNVPLITSNLPGFTDEMIEDTTGYIFESENVKSLEDTMIKAIETCNNDGYETLRDRMKKHINNLYSDDAIIRIYSDMFEEVINN